MRRIRNVGSPANMQPIPVVCDEVVLGIMSNGGHVISTHFSIATLEGTRAQVRLCSLKQSRQN